MRFASALLALTLSGQQWTHYGGDAGGSKYSPLKQIDRSNVARLKVAWTFKTGELSDGRGDWPVRSAFEATPLMIDGVLYITTPFNRLLALDAETGRELWAFDPKIDRERPYNLFISRGASYWTDGRRKRLLFGTLDGRLFSIDAATGKPDPAFGSAGALNLRTGFAEAWPNSHFGVTSPPAIYGDLVITGAWVGDGEPKGPPGDVRAFNIRTGQLAWRFHTVPRPGEFGHDTWQGDAWKERGGVNPWSLLSVDTQRGIVFLPLTSPAYDYYGGDRKGANLFGDSLVALDANTGKRLWHFQTVHHNIWDYDLPSQPILVEALRAGQPVPAVAQATKTGFVFLFERTSGKPLFEIEERPVPASTVPGEWTSPTQPVPVKPAPFARQHMRPEELTTLPESRARCQELLQGATLGTLFTPLGENTTILFPGTNGGSNWPGPSFDPETRTLYVNSMDVGMIFRLVKRPEGATIPYRAQAPVPRADRFWDLERNPCQQPPWGHLTAISLDSGEFRWRSVLGVVDKLLERGLPPTGTSNLGGSIVTAGGLLFIGATNDARFRAFDKDTGKEVWTWRLPASAHASPMTYLAPKSRKQFVLIAAGGGNKYNNTYSDELLAFSLP